jgi:serine/threonine protein kinase
MLWHNLVNVMLVLLVLQVSCFWHCTVADLSLLTALSLLIASAGNSNHKITACSATCCGPSWCLSQEFCTDGTLSSYIATLGAVTPKKEQDMLRLLLLLRDAAHGLRVLHERNVVHGDLVSTHVILLLLHSIETASISKWLAHPGLVITSKVHTEHWLLYVPYLLYHMAKAVKCGNCVLLYFPRFPEELLHLLRNAQNRHNILVTAHPASPVGVMGKIADLGLARVVEEHKTHR